MSGPDFLDTNILVYVYDSTVPRKQAIAQDLVRRAINGEIVISTQVLSEFSATLLHKLSPPVPAESLMRLLDVLSPIRAVSPDVDMVRRAVQAHATYKLHYYDCMIVAAAERAGCGRIWSEDLNPGQKYFGIVVANPFLERSPQPASV